MARLAKHGAEIGRVTYTVSEKRYFSDGTIMRNCGFGWKLHAKPKPGKTIGECFEHARDRQAQVLAEMPALRAYRAALHNLAALGKRWKLHAAIEMMPDDPDGVWSECCDGFADNISADVSEIVDLCKLYRDAMEETNARRKARAESAALSPTGAIFA